MEFSSPIKVPDGRYFLKVTGQNRLQLNKLRVDSFNTKPVSFTVSESQAEQIKSLEQNVISKANERSAEWFGRKIQESTINKAFHSCVNGDTFDACLSTVGGDVKTVFWDSAKKMKDKDSEWNSSVDIIVELSGVWFLKKSFGPIFKILQVKENKTSVEYMFVDENEEDPSDYLD